MQCNAMQCNAMQCNVMHVCSSSMLCRDWVFLWVCNFSSETSISYENTPQFIWPIVIWRIDICPSNCHSEVFSEVYFDFKSVFFSLSKILDRYRKRLFRQSQVDPHPRRAARQRRRQPGVNVIKPFSSSPTLTSKQARMVVRGKFFFSLV